MPSRPMIPCRYTTTWCLCLWATCHIAGAAQVGVTADGSQQAVSTTGLRMGSDGSIVWGHDINAEDEALLTVRPACTDDSTAPPTKFRCALPHHVFSLSAVRKAQGRVVSMGAGCDSDFSDGIPNPSGGELIVLLNYGWCAGDPLAANVSNSADNENAGAVSKVISNKIDRVMRASQTPVAAVVLNTGEDSVSNIYIKPLRLPLPVLMVRGEEREKHLGEGNTVTLQIKGLKLKPRKTKTKRQQQQGGGELSTAAAQAVTGADSFQTPGVVYYEGLFLYKHKQYHKAVPLLRQAASMAPLFYPSIFTLVHEA